MMVLQSNRMGIRYFKKLGDAPVPLSNGSSVKFTSVDGGITAFFATDQPSLWAEFELCMQQQRSAITEIPDTQFASEYLEKKNNPQRPPLNPSSREELGSGAMRVSESTFRHRLEAQSAAGRDDSDIKPKPLGATVAEVSQQIASQLPTQKDFRPTVGKRSKPKNANPATT